MKVTKGTITTLFITIMTLSFLKAGYGANPKGDDGALVVKRQVCYLKDFTHIEERDCGLDVIADLPVKGPKKLVDSITLFLNEELYEYFEDSPDKNYHLPFKNVFSTDIPHLLKHYRKAYSPYFDVKNPDICEFSTHCLELNMVTQTATYVTYEVVYVYFGEGLEENRDWVTFAKSDGHRLKEVITKENMLRFFQDYPEIRDNGIWSDIQFTQNEYGIVHPFHVGLLNDTLAFQYIWAPGIFDLFKYDLAPLIPYLTDEAQSFVKGASSSLHKAQTPHDSVRRLEKSFIITNRKLNTLLLSSLY